MTFAYEENPVLVWTVQKICNFIQKIINEHLSTIKSIPKMRYRVKKCQNWPFLVRNFAYILNFGSFVKVIDLKLGNKSSLTKIL